MIVTDGDTLKLVQLARLAIRMSDLLVRTRKGVYASIDEVSDAIQMVIEGKRPIIPALAPFVTWKIFHVGDRDINTVALTAADFGYDDMPTILELFDPKRLDTWSRLNADRLGGYAVETLNRDERTTIWSQDDKQTEGEILFTAVARNYSLNDDPHCVLFDIHWRLAGKWAENKCVNLHYRVGLTDRFLFRLRKV